MSMIPSKAFFIKHSNQSGRANTRLPSCRNSHPQFPQSPPVTRGRTAGILRLGRCCVLGFFVWLVKLRIQSLFPVCNMYLISLFPLSLSFNIKMAIQSDEYKTWHEDKLASQSPKFDTDRQVLTPVLGFIYKCKTSAFNCFGRRNECKPHLATWRITWSWMLKVDYQGKLKSIVNSYLSALVAISGSFEHLI